MKTKFILALAACTVLGPMAARPENLLRNPGFEAEGHWEAFESAALRNRWRSHDGGSYNAGLLGLWADSGLNAMVAQRDIPVVGGRDYLFQAWVWADLGWQPFEQYMKVVFFDADEQALTEESKPFRGLHPLWSPLRFRVTAPAGAVAAAVSIGANEVSHYGSLTIDDVFFGEADTAPEAR